MPSVVCMRRVERLIKASLMTEVWLQRALDMAHRQEAKAPEPRATMSLSRLWQQQGKRGEAHALLAPVYGWFTEGFGHRTSRGEGIVKGTRKITQGGTTPGVT